MRITTEGTKVTENTSAPRGSARDEEQGVFCYDLGMLQWSKCLEGVTKALAG